MSLTDQRLPGKTYKTERGLNIALDALARREAHVSQNPGVSQNAKQALNTKQTPNAEDVLDSLYGGIPTITPETLVKLVGLLNEMETPAPTPVVLDHIRNIHGVVVRVKIRDEERDKSRSITLQPRGQRGDIAKLSPSELASTNYRDNVGTLFEPLHADDAGYAMYQQTTNQKSVHAAADALRSEYGKKYETAVTVRQSLANRSITVGEVVEVGGNSTQEHRTVVRRKEANAAEVMEIQAPYRAVLPGTQDHMTSQPLRSKEEAERVSAEYVRTHKSEEGPGAALAGFKIPGSFSVQTRVADDPATRTPINPVSGSEHI